ncbi:MAG: ABC transporter permease [Nitriliruptor sp.]|nr:MAG: ABC transporter permease [Nitriliruptor sp.]
MSTTTEPARLPAPDRALRERATFASTVGDTWVLTKRNLLRNVRLPQVLLFSTVQPIMFLLLFTYVFGGAIGQALPPVAEGEYINWLMPGLLVQISVFGAGQTAIGLTDDLSKGVIDRFRSLPMARSAVLAGRTFADLGRNSAVVTLMMLVGFLIGFRYQTSFLRFLAGVALGLAFAYSLSWVMAVIGLYVKDPEAAQSAVFLPVFPLVFASSVFLPTETMPDWLRVFADNQPITTVTNALRALMLGEGALPEGQVLSSQLLISLGWIVTITLVFSLLAIRAYRRAVD